MGLKRTLKLKCRLIDETLEIFEYFRDPICTLKHFKSLKSAD